MQNDRGLIDEYNQTNNIFINFQRSNIIDKPPNEKPTLFVFISYQVATNILEEEVEVDRYMNKKIMSKLTQNILVENHDNELLNISKVAKRVCTLYPC